MRASSWATPSNPSESAVPCIRLRPAAKPLAPGDLRFGRCRVRAMKDPLHTTSWPELAIGLYDRLTGRNAEITYEMHDLRVQVPSGTGTDATHASWVLNGSLRIRTREAGSPN
jgi:hypothetical protein